MSRCQKPKDVSWKEDLNTMRCWNWTFGLWFHKNVIETTAYPKLLFLVTLKTRFIYWCFNGIIELRTAKRCVPTSCLLSEQQRWLSPPCVRGRRLRLRGPSHQSHSVSPVKIIKIHSNKKSTNKRTCWLSLEFCCLPGNVAGKSGQLGFFGGSPDWP